MSIDEITILANKNSDISIFIIYDDNNEMKDASFNNFPSI
jgi:hypothetical protein